MYRPRHHLDRPGDAVIQRPLSIRCVNNVCFLTSIGKSRWSLCPDEKTLTQEIWKTGIVSLEDFDFAQVRTM